MKKYLGLVFTLFMSLAIVSAYWGQSLSNPNHTFFANGGDGLKDYFTTTYFVKYDTSYWHSNVMNYPHGENVMFTGSQPSISQLIKFISDNIYDISDYTVAIINIAMILSLIFGSIFLYLLLRYFELPNFYSSLVAIGITFLSPQIARMGGHYSLSYVFAIPCILYLMARFYKNPTIALSVLMAIFMLWAVGTHVYMLGFYAFVVVLFWVGVVLGYIKFSLKKGLLHFAIQFVIPLLFLALLVTLTDNATDRTSYPWGFLHLRARPESIFLPIGKPYAQFLYRISNFNYVEWEAYAFVGLIATVGFVVMVIAFLKNVLRKKWKYALWPKSNHPMLNAFLWISAISLLYSFGLPFKLGLQGLIEYIGPLKQMRGIARFSWIFYYVLNIYIFYKIWHLKTSRVNRYIWYLIVCVAVSTLWYDAWFNTKSWSQFLNNSVPELSDTSHQLPDNRWVDAVDVDRYQAVLPIPFFHVGSENIWLDCQEGINVSTFVVSWKTGLPSMAVLMSRTSISQTLENLEVVMEPYRLPELLHKLNPQKDILVLAKETNTNIPESQLNIIRKSAPIYHSDAFNLYALSYDSLKSIFNNLYNKALITFCGNNTLYKHDEYLTTSSAKDFVANTFNENHSDIYLMDAGSLSKQFKSKQMCYQVSVPSVKPNVDYILSFWMEGVHTDLMLRSQLIVNVEDSLGNQYYSNSESLFKLMKIIDGNWFLVEIPVNIRNCGDKLSFRLTNWDLRRQYYTIDQLLIRPLTTDVYQHTGKWIMKNNRFYLN